MIYYNEPFLIESIRFSNKLAKEQSDCPAAGPDCFRFCFSVFITRSNADAVRIGLSHVHRMYIIYINLIIIVY